MAASSSPAPRRVFISYTHDSREHKHRVRELSEKLRNPGGLDCRIDQQVESPAEGWPKWCKRQIRDAKFVLVVCTEIYLRRYEGEEEPAKGLGGRWEGHFITQLIYDAEGKNEKFIPVVLAADDSRHIPVELRGVTSYDLSKPDEYVKLFRRITGQPEWKPSGIASQVPQLPTLQGTAAAPELAPVGVPAKQLFTVPFRPNPFFTGREDALDGLKNTLERNGIAALTGMGGVGKTQTAAHYAHQHREDYQAVLWVKAESQDTLFADLAQLAGRLELPEREAREQSVIVEAMKRWLEEHEGWLLVLDNVEDYGAVRELARKANENGRHVIITTQRQALGQIGRQRLTPMERDLGAVLLLRRAGRLGAPDPSASSGQAFGPATGAATKIGASAPGGSPGLKPVTIKRRSFRRAEARRFHRPERSCAGASDFGGSRRAAAGAGPGGRLYRRDGLRTGRLPDAAAATIRGAGPAARWIGCGPHFCGRHLPDLVGEAGRAEPGRGGAA